jgi:hypothetical protein
MAKYLHQVSFESFLFKKGSGLKRLWESMLHEGQKILPLLTLDRAVFSDVWKIAFVERADNSKQDNRLWLPEITF